MIDVLKPLIKQFMPFAQERMGFKLPPKMFLRQDQKNAENPLGKTAFYDPQASSITLYITGRHVKDIMRSLAHELVHHAQNCRGDFNGDIETTPGYAQDNEHLRNMEKEAYEMGNICFRDWEDSIKNTIQYEHLQKGEQQMSIKDWKNKEIKSLLSEAWGFKMDLTKLNEGSDQGGEEDAEEDVAGEASGWNKMEEVEEIEEEKDETLQEDSGEKEDEHYEKNREEDEDHIEAIRHHLDALEGDRAYDEDHIEDHIKENEEQVDEMCPHSDEEEVVVDMGGEGDMEQGVPELVANVQAALDALMMAVGSEQPEPVMQEQKVRKAIRLALKEINKRIKK
jgi:hypothetical protein